MKHKIIISCIIVVIFILSMIPNISLGAGNLDKDIADFKDFDDYIKAVETLTPEQVKTKIDTSYFKRLYGDAWQSFQTKWAQDQQAVETECANAEKNEDFDGVIEKYRQLLENAYYGLVSSNDRPYETEYFYLYVLNYKETAGEADKEVDEDDSVEDLKNQFESKANELENKINEILEGNFSSDEMTEKQGELTDDMLILRNLYETLNQKAISEEEIREISSRFTEINNLYNRLSNESQEQAADEAYGDTIYTQLPKKADTGNAGDSLDDLFNDVDEFANTGNAKYGDLQGFSNTIYNIFLAIGIVVAVIVGAVIGVKLMTSNIETKVEAKKLLIPYLVGCVVVFGGFAIWKIAVTILQGM